MMGRTHKMIGTGAGIALFIYGTQVLKDPTYATMPVTCAFGAMLPDIDHNNSKLGSQRKKAMGILGVVFTAALVASIAYVVIKIFVFNQTPASLMTYIIIEAVLSGIFILNITGFWQKKFKFAYLHRGIMHTLLIPAILGYLAIYSGYISDGVFNKIVLGIMFGYLLHLFADLLTVRGCPVLWPLTTNSIHIMNLKTVKGKSGKETFVGGVLCMLMVAAAMYAWLGASFL